jgi:hypothetical protein
MNLFLFPKRNKAVVGRILGKSKKKKITKSEFLQITGFSQDSDGCIFLE